METGAADPKRVMWMAIAAGAAALAAVAVRKGLDGAWRAATDEEPPEDPASHDVPWSHALLWTAANGALISVGQLLARRGAEAGWHRLTGDYPDDD